MTVAYTHYATIAMEIDFSGSAGQSGVQNMTATIKAKSDSVIWTMFPGGTYDNSAIPFLVSTDNNPNHSPTSSVPIAQLQFSNETGGDKQMTLLYIPTDASGGNATALYINAYIWGDKFAVEQNTVNIEVDLDSGVQVFINAADYQKDGTQPVPVVWTAFPKA
ncbi:MAG TPA: hypothetical protein VHC91_12145 [Trinickia sp.]|uniref:hypothetical protein n=1 Tax=Trinickia sp. TaxID=2571163 RepID=UPI002C77CF04|nr:hypothetical protein [Trinickia sp.]HVW51127.1 hypothetical protein [Trinickia sp.]